MRFHLLILTSHCGYKRVMWRYFLFIVKLIKIINMSKKLDEKASEYSKFVFDNYETTPEYKIMLCEADFKAGYELCQKEYEEKLRWIPVEEKEPEYFETEEDGIYYSKYLELKVNGYEYPLIGYYVSANDDQFFDIISEKYDDIKQEDITHFRECFL